MAKIGHGWPQKAPTRKGKIQQELLAEVWPYFQYHRQVVVLGDAEFSNEPVINWLRQVGWDFVFRFQRRYQLQLTPKSEWLTAQTIYQAAGVQPGEVHHWRPFGYTEAHAIAHLTMTVHWEQDEDELLCLISSLAGVICFVYWPLIAYLNSK